MLSTIPQFMSKGACGLHKWRPLLRRRLLLRQSDCRASHGIPFERSSTDETPKALQQKNSTITNRERHLFVQAFDDVTTPPTLTVGKSKGNGSTQSNAPFHISQRNMAATAAEKLFRKHFQEIKRAAEDSPPEKKAQQYIMVEDALKNAKTDVEIWNIISTEVFRPIRVLNVKSEPELAKLSRNAKKRQKKRTKVAKKTASAITDGEEQEIPSPLASGQNFSTYLLIAARQLRVEFPTSALMFSILPALKALGRAPYAWVASTLLYNEVIAATWLAYAEFRQIDQLLQEMDNSGLEFDENTLYLVDSIRREGNYGRKGTHGEVRQMIWKSDHVQLQWKKIARWSEVIKERLADDSLRKANEEQYMQSDID